METLGNFTCGAYQCIFFIIWQMIFELENLELGFQWNIICQMIFFMNFICFHVLHNIRHKISTIFMMLKMFSCADLFSRLLCWSIYWWIMWFPCGFEYITKITTGYISQQWLELVFAVNIREKSGNYFLPTPWQTYYCYPCTLFITKVFVIH